MPLIEAFLAFALTMLAFAAALSAVIGVWLRALRWRAAGLRRTLEVIFDERIAPFLPNAGGEDRLEFIADMTFTISPRPGESSTVTRTNRLAELRKAYSIGSGGTAWLDFVLAPLRRWRSLRYGLDLLPEAQFQLRLNDSAAGKKLASIYGADEWSGYKAYLTQYFTAVGVGASEDFGRRARVRTVAAGVLLALLVNADSFDLLNAYMTDEALRRDIIARQDEIVGRASTPDLLEGEQEAPRAAAVAARADARLESAQTQIAALAASPLLDAAGRDAVAGLAAHLGDVRADVQTATQLGIEAESAAAATRNIAAGLVKTFPIGWDGYPNCKPRAVDLRCMNLNGRLPATVEDETPLHAVVLTVAQIDTAAFVKWLLGVVLTAFMAGLGAPFWVKTVDRVLGLKNHVQRAASAAAADEQAPAAAAARREQAPPAATTTLRLERSPTGDTARRAADAVRKGARA